MSFLPFIKLCLFTLISLFIFVLPHACISLSLPSEAATKKTPFPCPTTYRTALSYYVDITSPPRTNVLKELAEYATDPKDKEFLLKITSSSDDGKVSVNHFHKHAQTLSLSPFFLQQNEKCTTLVYLIKPPLPLATSTNTESGCWRTEGR